MNNKRKLDISFSSKTGRKQFKPLTVSVQSGSPQDSSPSQEPGLQNKSHLVEQSQTPTPKSSRLAWQGLRRTLSMINTQLDKSLPASRRHKENLLLNTSWPRKTRRKIDPLPICISSKKIGTTELESELDATHSESENYGHSLPISTPKSYNKPWNRLKNTLSSLVSMNSFYGEDSEDLSVEHTPNTQVTTIQKMFNQSVPTSRKKITPKSKGRCLKGGFVEEYRKMLEKMAMEGRHLNLRKPSHTVSILSISESFGVKMALVRSETEPESGPPIFNIILNPNLANSAIVGSRLQLYLDEEPIQLANKQIVHLQSNKIILL